MKTNILMLFVLICLAGCKKTVDEPVDEPAVAPFIRPMATPVACKQPVSAIIGPEGGKLVTRDALLSLEIPAGAVQNNTTFTIQQVSSTLEGSGKPTYKISPENLSFLKPAVIRFHYANMALEGSDVNMLAPAYQDEKGIYHAPEFLHDKIAKVITVFTTHFSSWTLYDQYKLSGPDEVGTNGFIKVRLMTYPLLHSLNEDALLMEWDEAAIGTAIGNTDDLLKTAQWKLAGEGGLTLEGLHTVYSAPSQVPAANPVMLSLSMTGKFSSQSPVTEKYILLHPVTITSDEYFTATIDGKKYNVTDAVFVRMPRYIILSGRIMGKMLTMTVSATGIGNYAFGQQHEPGRATLSYIYDNQNGLISQRNGCSLGEPDLIFSPGSVNITAFPEPVGGFLKGSVTGAVLYTHGDYCKTKIKKEIKLSFNVPNI